MQLNLENIEYYIIEYIEGNLSEADSSILLKFIGNDPELMELLTMYHQTIITLDTTEETSIVFEDKDTLLKTPTKQVVFSKVKPIWRSVAAAVAIMIVFTTYWMNTNFEKDISDTYVQATPPAQHKYPATSVSQNNQTTTNMQLASTGAQLKSRSTSSTVTKQIQDTTIHNIATVHKNQELNPKMEYAMPIPTHTNRNLIVEAYQDITLLGSKAPTIHVQNIEEEQGWLQYVDLPQMPNAYLNKESIISAYTNIKEKVKAIATDWEQTAVVLQLGEKSIYLKR